MPRPITVRVRFHNYDSEHTYALPFRTEAQIKNAVTRTIFEDLFKMGQLEEPATILIEQNDNVVEYVTVSYVYLLCFFTGITKRLQATLEFVKEEKILGLGWESASRVKPITL